MPDLIVREFSRLARDGSGQIVAAGEEPGLRDTWLNTGNPGPLTLLEKTKFVELHAKDVDWYYTFNGTATNTTSMRIVADTTIFKGVVKGGSTLSAVT